MNKIIEKAENFMELGGVKKDIVLLIISGTALLISIFDLVPLPFDAAWAAIILCGIPIMIEAIIGLITAFDIKADVLVSLALVASVCIGEDFAAGEVAFIMQLGALLEDLTVAKARAGIERLVQLTPQTARVVTAGGEKNNSCRKSKSWRYYPCSSGRNGCRRWCDPFRADLGESGSNDRGSITGR